MKWRWSDLSRGRKIALAVTLSVLSAYTALVVVYNLTKTDPPKTTVATRVEPEKPVCKANGEELLGYINAERRKLGVHELRIHPKLSQSAKLKFDDMVANKYYGHNRTDGSSFGHFLDQVGWTGWVEEDLAINSMTPDVAWASYKNSKNHYASLTNPRFRYAGIYTQCVNFTVNTETGPKFDGGYENKKVTDLTVVHVAE